MKEIDFTPETIESTAQKEAAEASQEAVVKAAAETVEASPEATESTETAETAEGAQETPESGEALGYSSSYYAHQAAGCLASGNRIGYKNNMRYRAQALVREQTKR